MGEQGLAWEWAGPPRSSQAPSCRPPHPETPNCPSSTVPLPTVPPHSTSWLRRSSEPLRGLSTTGAAPCLLKDSPQG